MPHDTIIIARHGKPALSRKVRLTWRQYREWWKLYDIGGIVPDQKVPPKLKSLVKEADVLISSPLLRARESLELATGKKPDLIIDDLIEAALPSPNFGPLTLRPKSWGTWSRIIWYVGWSGGMETHKEARIRANNMADRLSEEASNGRTIYVSAHGWFNRMMKGSLKKQGWKCVSQNGDLHWSFRRFTRPTDYKDLHK